MKAWIYGWVLLIVLLGCSSCRTKRVSTVDSREVVHTVTADTTKQAGRLHTDTLRVEQIHEERDSLREVEDVQVNVDYNEAGKPTVIRIHRERTGVSSGKTWQNDVSMHVIRDTATVSTHVGGTDREVETVAHVRETRVVGVRPYVGILVRLILLAALVILAYKIGLIKCLKSMFSSR